LRINILAVMKTSTFALSLVSVVFFFSACKLDTPVFPKLRSTTAVDTTSTGTGTTGTGTGTSASSEYYFKGTMGTQAFDWGVTDDANGWVVGSSANGSTDKGVITDGITALFSASKGYKPQFGIEFRTFQVNYDDDKSAYFNSFVKTGAWAYAADDSYIVNKKLIAFTYTDINGKGYSSEGVQTGSSANVISVTQVPALSNVSLDESLKIKISFSCTLYPIDGSGDQIKISNAEAIVNLQNLL
jgi:hypothetical protein